MNTKGFRRMLFGEKMPDKNDPQYKERMIVSGVRRLLLMVVIVKVSNQVRS